MRLAIFGATGATGLQLVTQGLAQGHEIVCLVRNVVADRFPAGVMQLPGDGRDGEPVNSVIARSDAVLSALGSRSLKENDLLDQASACILAGMKRNGVRRLIVLGAAGVADDAGKYQSFISRLVINVIRRTVLKYPFQDQAAQERRLQVSEVDYTIVRPPRLTHGAFTGRYRIEADALPPASKSIARADIADFMLKQLYDERFVRRGVYIAR